MEGLLPIKLDVARSRPGSSLHLPESVLSTKVARSTLRNPSTTSPRIGPKAVLASHSRLQPHQTCGGGVLRCRRALVSQPVLLPLTTTRTMGNLCSKSSNEPDHFSQPGRVLGSSADSPQPTRASVPPKISANTPGRTLGGDNAAEDARGAAAKAAEVRIADLLLCHPPLSSEVML